MCQSCRKRCTCGSAREFPDTMRYGRFPYEVRGNDYAAKGVAHQQPTLNEKPISATNPLMNQAETGYVEQSPSSSALRAALPRTVRQMEPIPYAHKFQGFIGGLIVKSAQNIPVVPLLGYEGIMPMNQQPVIRKPLPYPSR